MRLPVLLLAGACAAAQAAEVTVIRPTAFVSAEWPYYVMLGDEAVADLRSGEYATVQVPAGTRSLAIQCPKSAAGFYAQSQIDYDFKPDGRAFFVISPREDCVTIRAVDAKTAEGLMFRALARPAARPVAYEKPKSVNQPAPGSASPDAIAAATAAWVDAFNSRDAARLSALYDPEAVLTDASEARPRMGAAAIADYYKDAAKRPTQRVALGERSIRRFGDTAIDSGTLTYFEMRDGSAITTPGRYSLTYQNRGGRWLIVDHHASPGPR